MYAKHVLRVDTIPFSEGGEELLNPLELKLIVQIDEL